ncbi:MAG: hypothetical protein WAM53_11630 [Terrimicrobiaceae bacterium]
MMKRKAFWALLAAGMTVVSINLVSAQWVDHEMLTRMMSGATAGRTTKSQSGSIAATLRAEIRALSKKGAHFGASSNSLVGSWLEKVTFDSSPDRVLQSLVIFNDDGTTESNDQGSVTTDPPWVFSSGVGVWARLGNRTFAYTLLQFVSDLNTGELIGCLKVSGTYKLKSDDEYIGRSYYKLSVGDLEVQGWVSNEGDRICLRLPPKE